MSWLPHDPLLALVFQAGLGIIACSLLMLAAVFLLRLRLVLRLRRERRHAALWRPLLAECVYAVPETLPKVPHDLRYHFMKLWNHHHESLEGGARDNLEKLARALGLDVMARGMLQTSDLRLRLIAIITLGHLGDRQRWPELRALVSDSSPMLSLAAARALLDIDARATLPWLVMVMAAREDWPLARLVAMLKEAGPDQVTAPLVAALQAAGSPAQTVRLLRMLEVAHSGPAGAAAARVVRESEDPEVIAAGLRLLGDPRDLELARVCAVHASWVVRVAAARLLGRIGEPGDRRLLACMLGDAHWWVRYHAARALTVLPFTSLEELEKVRLTLNDRFASDMLAQAIAEARAR
ncbi:MAG: HEAT repeat domain-containing protein [Burkholderiales bacterium]|nr:HEAT repeat domain-containing protein [Burkholderiales bacterium]